jgi:hypothetical protein
MLDFLMFNPASARSTDRSPALREDRTGCGARSVNGFLDFTRDS